MATSQVHDCALGWVGRYTERLSAIFDARLAGLCGIDCRVGIVSRFNIIDRECRTRKARTKVNAVHDDTCAFAFSPQTWGKLQLQLLLIQYRAFTDQIPCMPR
jgi:hypothetical protein